ncbi:hypothetical protein [Bradyrhizobium sp. CCBAU 51753]|uniref:hypothetical protein n=1 Tax=Bradyrhizobium sp. CCBAU 51753 TaxID=1325100 RepID=UPI0018BF8D1C|nr:hypothetical protein [Bradyrhizobium sp. CCBAU 51753]QOZ25315.1 hypothetical protein XH93_18240 [Bradyrhizobium sp. CCBAU 51753]
MKLTDQLLTVAETYCSAKEISLARVSTLIFNDGKRFAAIQRGGNLGTDQFEKAISWFSERWDDNTPWPIGFPRPKVPLPERSDS